MASVNPELPVSENKTIALSKPELAGKTIICRVWSHDGSNGSIPTVVKKATKKYGDVDFTIKTGKTKRRYQINYTALKQDGKKFIYDTTFDNAVGALTFFRFNNEKVDSKQAETMLQDGAVDFFIAKGGIPMWYLLICIIGMIAISASLALIAPDYINMKTFTDQIVTQDENNRQIIKQQAQQMEELRLLCGERCTNPIGQ